MTSWIEDVSTLLADNGFGTEATDLFIGSLPDPDSYPGAVMALTPYQGRKGDEAFGPMGEAIQTTAYPRFQAYFRDAQYEFLAPYARAMSVYLFLENAMAVVIGSSHFRDFVCRMPGVLGPQDATGRWVISFGVEVNLGL